MGEPNSCRRSNRPAVAHCDHGAAILPLVRGPILHDGRTMDLLVAIQEHARDGGGYRSEANDVVGRFNRLGRAEQQDIVNFLRSL